MRDDFCFGENLRMCVFGSSHGDFVGVEIDGCPKGIEVSEREIQLQLDRRRPGGSAISSQRQEADRLVVQGGIKGGKTTGGKIRMLIRNIDVRKGDYARFEETPRPGHADFVSKIKYGKVESGGGFFSGRMTAAFVMAGAVAKKILAAKKIRTMAFARQIGKIEQKGDVTEQEILKNTYNNDVRAADFKTAGKMRKEIENAMKKRDSVGGIVECRIIGVPAGIGGPVFGSLESSISDAIYAIPGVKGVAFGSGFAGAGMRGSQHNDAFRFVGGKIITNTNYSGGILGGISNGMPIVFHVAFKPTPSIGILQETVDLKKGINAKMRIIGRHDPCIAIRAVAVVENIAAICMADEMMRAECDEAGLSGLRRKIDAVDREIIGLVGERMRLALSTAKHKRKIMDKKRESEVLSNASRNAAPFVSEKFAADLFRKIIGESRRIQKRK